MAEELNSVTSSAIETSWVGQANKEAKTATEAMVEGADINARANNIQERLNKIGPSNKVLEGAMNFLRKQLKDQENKAKKSKEKQTKEEEAEKKFTGLAKEHLEKAKGIREIQARRVTSQEVANNVNEWMRKEGYDVAAVDLNRPRNWREKWIGRPLENLRIGWNELLAKVDSNRAEGRFQNAKAYRISAEALFKMAELTRDQISGREGAFEKSAADRVRKLENQREIAVNQRDEFGREANAAANRMEYARTEMPTDADIAAKNAETSMNPTEVAANYLKQEAGNLENAGNRTQSAGNI